MPDFAKRQVRPQNSYLVSPARPDREMPRPTHAENPVLTQQQALSNQVMQRFAQSCPLRLPSPSLCLYGGACHTCPAPVPAKLTVNKPGDKYEQEADRVADEVMRMPESRVQRACSTCDDDKETLQVKPLTGRITPLVQRQVEPEEDEEEEEAVQTKLTESTIRRQKGEPEDEEESLQTKLADGAQIQRQEEEEEPSQTKQTSGRTLKVGPGLQAQIHSLRGGGQPLSHSVRNFFEPRFGHDFSRVRVHTDNQAGEISQAMNARAFTIGQDIMFGAEQYAPETLEGRRVLAHELTHTVQQAGGATCSWQAYGRSASVQLQGRNPFRRWRSGVLSEIERVGRENESARRLRAKPNLYDPNFVLPVRIRFSQEQYLYDFRHSGLDLDRLCGDLRAEGCTPSIIRASKGLRVTMKRRRQTRKRQAFNSVLRVNVIAFPVKTTLYVPKDQFKRETFNHELYHLFDAYRTFQAFKHRLAVKIQAKVIRNRQKAAKQPDPNKRKSLLSGRTIHKIAMREADPFVRYFQRHLKSLRIAFHSALNSGAFSEKRPPKMWRGFKMPVLRRNTKGSFT